MKHLKQYENIINDYEVIATNNSYYSWEYDSHSVKAQILLDRKDDSLYLKIRSTHKKSGLGAGTISKDLEFINIGDLNKSNLALVRLLLKKHSLQQSKFKLHWEDDEGNKMTLSEVLDIYKPKKEKTLKKEKIEKKLNHIQHISKFTEVSKSDIEILKYSEKSYAIFGDDTKKIKDKLSELGCKYNRFLTDPKTGSKRPGWICSISKIDLVKKLI